MADYYWDESASESDIEKEQVLEWCIECQSQEPMTKDDELCSCCFHQVEVMNEGLPSVFSDYWRPTLESQLIGCCKSCDNPPPVYQSLNNREDVIMKYLKNTVQEDPEVVVHVELNNWTELFE